jgi:hypothetical protein
LGGVNNMNKNSIEIPLVKATYEELQEVICELQVERYKYKTIIDKIKEIINHYAVENEDYSKIYNQEETEIMKILEEIE